MQAERLSQPEGTSIPYEDFRRILCGMLAAEATGVEDFEHLKLEFAPPLKFVLNAASQERMTKGPPGTGYWRFSIDAPLYALRIAGLLATTSDDR